MGNARDAIPEPVKLAVRRKCGFGCVCCGFPIVQYHHHPPYSQTGRHVAEELFLLCPNCHEQEKKGLLSNSTILEAAKTPFNLHTSVTTPYTLTPSRGFRDLVVGGNTLRLEAAIGSINALVVDDDPVLGIAFEGENALITLQWIDHVGNLDLLIVNNELIASSNLWDFECVANRMRFLRDSKTKLSLHFDPKGALTIEEGSLQKGPHRIDLSRKGLAFGAFQMQGCTVIVKAKQAATGALITVGNCPSIQFSLIRRSLD